MVFKCLISCNTLVAILIFFTLANHSSSDDSQSDLPSIGFIWSDNKNKYTAGEIAVIIVRIYKDFKSEKDKRLFNPTFTVNGTQGNSSLITELSYDWKNRKITFIPMMVGRFYIEIDDNRFNVHWYALDYHVSPGPMYEPGGIVSWMGDVDNVIAGEKSTIFILPKDAFGNTITSKKTEPKDYKYYVASARDVNGTVVTIQDEKYNGWNKFGYISFELTVNTAGHILVHVTYERAPLNGSPLLLTVHPRPIDIGNCLPQWIAETKFFQIFSYMETIIHQRDNFGNLVPGLYKFSVEAFVKGSNLHLPVGDVIYKELSPGIQSLSFKLDQPGDYILIISDTDKKNPIMNMPFEFNVYTGYVNSIHSMLEGDGLDKNVRPAGWGDNFMILLRDEFEYHAPLDKNKLQIRITLAAHWPEPEIRVDTDIYPRISVSKPGALGNSSRSSEYDTTYKYKKSGTYEISVFCGNIQLNQGKPILKVVSPGNVDLSKSKLVKYALDVAGVDTNLVLVELMDSFYNRVPNQAKNLTLDVVSAKRPQQFYAWYKDNQNGTITVGYIIVGTGRFELSFAFQGQRVLPFAVNVFTQGILPKARDEEVYVFEDNSIGIDALDNDLPYHDYPKILGEICKPSHGSVLVYGHIFRYTPYKGYFGEDTFSYTITDGKGHNSSATVTVHVISIPPRFVSSPSQLLATEDMLSPKFGGFHGLELTYSDTLENISVMISAQHGSVFLSPRLMQLWDPIWNELSVSKAEDKAGSLKLTGRLEIINYAFQLLKYIGKEERFNGKDNITLSITSASGKKELNIPMYIQPINDPPYIIVPKFIIVDNDKNDKGFLIFDKQRDKFNVSIGDPDLHHYSGNESEFQVMFSVEVTSGYLSAKLPAGLISTTELKAYRSNQWQPLQTFVAISRHFAVEAKGIRLRGTIRECNSLLQQLFYVGDEHEHDGVLRVSVNDMGFYGCSPDCSEMESVALMTNATINLITRTPISSLVAHSLGSVILLESIALSVLILILMFFMCKSIIVILRKKKKCQVESQNLQHDQHMSRNSSSENMMQLTENSVIPLAQTEQPSNILKPVEETDIEAEVATTFQ
ncbi:protein GAMETE EXPRESSED 2 [Rutidosis leptorrhynchoides]|uniref:protein GAMETE EXPRESSED 2 n=1 Tax=Rutidosis leptorrhynchoides TaxID=125765 RepID=UPI003A99794D